MMILMLFGILMMVKYPLFGLVLVLIEVLPAFADETDDQRSSK